MRYARAAAVIATLSLVSACAWKRTPVPLISDTGSTALLVGTWAGEYKGRETGRSGSITFDLASEKDTAYCDIVMVPKIQTMNVVTNGRPELRNLPSVSLAQPLRIRFIRLGEGQVSGTLDPYTDPECDCRVVTTFEGKITGANSIEGTYTTRGNGIPAATGTWSVNRQKTSAGTK